MKSLASYIMRGPLQAALVCMTTAALSLLVPPLSYLSGAAVGLVALRQGPWAGAKVAIWAALAVGLMSGLSSGNPGAGAAYLLVVWLPVLAAATSLRRTVSLPRSVLLCGLFGALVVAGFYLAVDDPAAWWRATFNTLLQSVEGPKDPRLAEAVQGALGQMTGRVAAALALGVVMSLFIARWWQAVLYNPGGFREEFHRLRLGRELPLLTLALVAAAGLAHGVTAHVAADLLVVAVVLQALQGIAVVHALVVAYGAGAGWLVALYALLILTSEQTALTLAVAGMVDNWFDFRTFFAGRKR